MSGLSLSFRTLARRLGFWAALTVALSAPSVHAYRIEASASNTFDSVFSQTYRDQEISQTQTMVSASQNGPDPSNGHFNSFSSVDLTTGKLRGYSAVNSTTGGITTEAEARLDEILNLSLKPGIPEVEVNPPPPPFPPGFIPVGLVLHAEGSFDSLSGGGTARALFQLFGGTASLNTGNYMVVSCANPCNAVQVFGGFPSGIATISSSPGGWAADLSTSTYVDPTLPFEVHATMSTQSTTIGRGSVILDASNTASIEVVLPANYGFSSSSGVFLAAVSSVPDLHAALLMPAGLLVLLALIRRKRPMNTQQRDVLG